MKKAMVVLLIMLILFGNAALAESSPNFSELTDEEIIRQIQDACRELAIRSSQDKTIIYQDDSRSILITLDGIENHSSILCFEGTIINGSTEIISLQAMNVYINNWQCKPSISLSAKALRNNKGIFNYADYAKFDNTTVEDIKLLEGEYLIEIGDEKIIIPFVYTDFKW